MPAIANLKQALEKHRALLEQHITIWQTIHREIGQGPQLAEIATRCKENTESMLLACDNAEKVIAKGMNESIQLSSGRKHGTEEPEDLNHSKKVKRVKGADLMTPAVSDPSGLFMIDSNPSKVNDLLRKYANDVTKCKLPIAEQEPADIEVPSKMPEQGTSRKIKRKMSQVVESHHIQASPNEIDRQHQAFEAKVELRLREKDKEREKKATRKRKRESDASVANSDAPIASEPSVAASNSTTNNKKKKNQAKAGHNHLKLPSITDNNKDKRHGNTVPEPNISRRAKKRLKVASE